jgi:hypothetical protein
MDGPSHAEQLGGSLRAGEYAAGLCECSQDVLPLDVL